MVNPNVIYLTKDFIPVKKDDPRMYMVKVRERDGTVKFGILEQTVKKNKLFLFGGQLPGDSGHESEQIEENSKHEISRVDTGIDNLITELRDAVKALMFMPIDKEELPPVINISLVAQMPEVGQPPITFSPVIQPSTPQINIELPKEKKHIQTVKRDEDNNITGSETDIEYEK